MIVNEELEYVLETIRFKTSIYRDQKKRNLTFNDDDYYSNILNEYITNLQQENTQLKDKLKDIEKILDADCCVENVYQAMCQYLNIHDFELDLEDYLKEN